MQPKIIVYLIACVAISAAPARAQGRRGHFGSPGPVFIGGFYGPYYPAFGFDQWYPYPGPVIGYPPGYSQGRSAASVRTQVTPRETQVFVDGYSAGVADDFDGVFQRLQLIPGPHEITFYLPGYRTYRESVYLSSGSSHNIRHTMVQRPAGEPDEAAPVPSGPPIAGRSAPPAPNGQRVAEPSRFGTLSLGIQPGDANVLIDGEAWRGPQSQARFSVQLAEGHHHLQIDKAGFETFSVDVDVKAGETTSLNVMLTALIGR